MRPTAFALLASVAAAPVLAQEITDGDRAAIEARMAQYDEAMASGDLAALVGYVPPPLMDYIAGQAGVPADALVDTVRAQMGGMLDGVTIDAFAMDLDAAAFQLTPDGSRTYGLIPTTTTMTVEGAGTMRAASDTVAIEDGGDWYLVRVDDASQVAILTAVYPEFEGVAFTPGTMEAVE